MLSLKIFTPPAAVITSLIHVSDVAAYRCPLAVPIPHRTHSLGLRVIAILVYIEFIVLVMLAITAFASPAHLSRGLAVTGLCRRR